MGSNEVNVTIGEDLIKPIVKTKIQAAIAEALGDRDAITKHVIEMVMTQRVDYTGKRSSYDRDNKYSFFEVAIESAMCDAIKEAFAEWVAENKSKIKEAMVTYLETKKARTTLSVGLLNVFTDICAKNLVVELGVKAKQH